MSDDKWNNEINTKISKVTPLSLYVPRTGIKIFLAGSICEGTAPDWQADVSTYIEQSWTELDITVYNPRMPGEFSHEMDNEHAAWTMSMISAADYILLHLTGDTGSPISTFELGLFVKSPKLFLSVDDSYRKKELIEYHYNYFGVRKQYETPNDCVDAMKATWYKGMINE